MDDSNARPSHPLNIYFSRSQSAKNNIAAILTASFAADKVLKMRRDL